MTDSILSMPRALTAALGSFGLVLACAAPVQAQWLNPPRTAPAKQFIPGLMFCNGYEADPACTYNASSLEPVVELEKLSPAFSDVSIQFRAGWPLIFRASVNAADMLGLGRMHGEQYSERRGYQFAEFGQGGGNAAGDAFDDFVQ